LEQADFAPLYERLIAFGRGDHDRTTTDLLLGPSHPLSAFQIDFGPTSLVAPGLRAAAAVAATEEHQQQVAQIAIGSLRDRDEIEMHDLVTALATLPADALPQDITMFANDARADLRALAAVVWSQHPAPPQIGVALAVDTVPIVRRTLANNVRTLTAGAAAGDMRQSAWAQVLVLLTADVRESIRSIARDAQTNLADTSDARVTPR
jgi:hypothetical protein